MSNSGWNRVLIEQCTLETATDMIVMGQRWAKQLKKGSILALYGDLGAGKTTFIKGLVSGLGAADERAVASPTFTHLHIYEQGPVPVYHFDLYRLRGVEDFFALDFDEYLERDGICCIEWAERIEPLLVRQHYRLLFEHQTIDQRRLTLWYDKGIKNA